MMTQAEKEYLFFSNPKCIEIICDNIIQGGSLIELSKTVGIRYCDIMKFIRSDADRAKAYDTALADRGEWFKETLLGELKEVVIGEPEQDKESGMAIKCQTKDRLKAIELLGKNVSLFTERVEHNVSTRLEDLILASYKK